MNHDYQKVLHKTAPNMTNFDHKCVQVDSDATGDVSYCRTVFKDEAKDWCEDWRDDYSKMDGYVVSLVIISLGLPLPVTLSLSPTIFLPTFIALPSIPPTPTLPSLSGRHSEGD